MKKYRVREGSFIDYGRYGLVGLLLGLFLAWVTTTAYPIV